MRKVVVIVMLAAVGIAAAGCGGRGDRTAPATSTGGQVAFDQAFIDAMVPHHRSAIEMAREAKAQGLSEPDLIEIADAIESTQQDEINKMLQWREEWFGSSSAGAEEQALDILGLSAADAGMEHSAMELSSAHDVDKAFAQMMIPHHRGAVRMARLAQQRANHDEIKNLARAIISAQEREIETMQMHAGGMQH